MRNDLIWRRTCAVAVIVIILAGSSVPGTQIPRVFSITPDKLIHCLEYAVLGFFLFRWMRLEYNSTSLIRISTITFLSGSFVGIVDETYQRLIPGRSPDFWDWVLDSVGVLLSIMLMNFIIKRRTSPGK